VRGRLEWQDRLSNCTNLSAVKARLDCDPSDLLDTRDWIFDFGLTSDLNEATSDAPKDLRPASYRRRGAAGSRDQFETIATQTLRNTVALHRPEGKENHQPDRV
jgi:hypothetical protein